MSSIEQLILGESHPIRQLRALIARVAPASLPVMVEGPTGSGKELVARALHEASGRSGRFVPFNVCAIGDGMFEDALFGHVRGAFTGALSDRPGFLEEANGGTVFLDEMSGLCLSAQAKLLRAVESGVFRPVGARGDRRSDFRLVAATNVPLARLVAQGTFRPDLSYRLAGVSITVPSLRERRDDIPQLARHFLSRVDPSGALRLTDAAVGELQSHDWPGNVRELEHAVARLVLLSTRPMIGRDSVRQALPGGGEDASSLKNAMRMDSTSQEESSVSRRDFMARRLLSVLEAVGWNMDEAARQLGVHPTTVYRRLRQLRGRPPQDSSSLRPSLHDSHPTAVRSNP